MVRKTMCLQTVNTGGGVYHFRSGFTLIELLAVIVILAIISLIAVPITLNIIEKALVNSYKISSGNIVRTAELYYNEKSLDNNLSIEGNLFEIMKSRISGTKPSSGEVFISSTGKVSVALKYGDFCYSKGFLEENLSEEKKKECVANQIGKDIKISYTNIIDSTGFKRTAIYGDELSIDFKTTTSIPKALQITMDGKIISELVHYTYEDGMLVIPNITGNIEIKNIEGYCASNGINNLASCLIATDTMNTNIETSKNVIKAKQADLAKIEPQIDYGETEKEEITGDNIRSISNTIYCTSDKPTFNSKTGRYTFTNGKLVDIPNCVSTVDNFKYTCFNITNNGNCNTIYEIKEYRSEEVNNVTRYIITKENRYGSKVLGESISKPGLYATTDDDGDTFYFRGTATNNYVNFAGFTWRVVRINGDGSIKLIYSGTSPNATGIDTTIGNSQFNNNLYDPAMVGYKYGLNQVLKHTANISINDNIDAGTNYYYADNYTCDDITKMCKLSGNFIQGKWVEKYNEVVNGKKYTCFSTEQNATCSIIKEIIETVPYEGGINSRRAKVKYHGYISNSYADTYADTTDSKIKQTIEVWYTNNLASYEGYLSDNAFCVDRSLASGTGSDLENTTSYGPYQRNVSTKLANLRCPREEDKYTKANGKLNHPIGLITADEVAYAGGLAEYDNQLYYLNIGVNYYTLSPSFFTAYNTYAHTFNVTTVGSLNHWPMVTNSYGVRPVINLKSDTLISIGDGTKSSPYIVMTN